MCNRRDIQAAQPILERQRSSHQGVADRPLDLPAAAAILVRIGPHDLLFKRPLDVVDEDLRVLFDQGERAVMHTGSRHGDPSVPDTVFA